jgi:hypothetical protein
LEKERGHGFMKMCYVSSFSSGVNGEEKRIYAEARCEEVDLCRIVLLKQISKPK